MWQPSRGTKLKLKLHSGPLCPIIRCHPIFYGIRWIALLLDKLHVQRQVTQHSVLKTVIAVCFLWVSVTMLVLESLLNGNKTNFNIRNNLAENKRPQYEALGNNYRVCGVFSLEPYDKVYCVRLNFNISQSVWYYNSCQG